MAIISTTQKAPVLDQDGVQLTSAEASVFSSDPAVASIDWAAGIYVVGQTVGTVTLTATRLSDGSTAELDVEVVADAPFSISLGTPVPK